MERKNEDVYIVSSGAYLPGKAIGNDEMAHYVPALSAGTFSSYFGINQRFMVVNPETCERIDGMGSLRMATEASRLAIKRAGIQPQDIDVIITTSTTPETVLPPLCFLLQKELGVKETKIFDLRGGCAASVEAIIVGKNFIENNIANTVLICGVECTSPIYYKNLKKSKNPSISDMLNGFIFGDGAAAIILQAGNKITNCSNTMRKIGFATTSSKFADLDIGFQLISEADKENPMIGTTKTKHFNKAISKNLPIVMESAFKEIMDGAGCKFEEFDHIIIPQVNKSLLNSAYPKFSDSFVHIFGDIGNIPGAAIFLAYDNITNKDIVVNKSMREGILAIETISWVYAVVELLK
jgi:3-oxoacyl-[acyl-carrier-protein] synthase-3